MASPFVIEYIGDYSTIHITGGLIMSKEALIKRGKTWVPVRISAVTKDDIRNEIRCNGRINGSELERCDAPMRIKWSTTTGEALEYTQAKNKDHPHKLGCEHDHRRPKITHTNLDMSCKNMQKQTFLQSMLDKEARKRNGPKGPDPDIPPHHGPDEHGPKIQDGDKEIIIKKRGPKSMLEAIQTLRVLHPNNIYMDTRVKDWIIADHTIVYHLNREYLPGEHLIALGKLVTPNQAKVSVDIKQNEWVLADITFQGKARHNHLFFKVHLTKEAKVFINEYRVNELSKIYYIGICAKWERHSSDANVYIAHDVSEKMLFRVPIDVDKLI